MKRLFMVLFVVLITIGVHAQSDFQSDYICIANNVAVRTGPGRNYSIAFKLSKEEGITNCYADAPVITSYNSFISYAGKKKNGFIKIQKWEAGMEEEGWVSAQYLRPVCRYCKGCRHYRSMESSRQDPKLKCRKCGGRGY
jgi:hypothetical protein